MSEQITDPTGAGGLAPDAGAGVGDGGTASPAPGSAPSGTWRDSISDELRDNPALVNLDSVEALAKEHVNLQQVIGRKGAVVPKDDAPEEDWNGFYKSLGRPDAPDGYSFAMPDGADATESDKAFQGEMGKLFHKAGLTPRQAEIMNAGWNEYTGQLGAAAETSKAEAGEQMNAAITKNWGAERDAKMDLATRAARAFGFEPDSLSELEHKVGSFKMLDTLAKIGAVVQEDGGLLGKGGVPLDTNPAGAKAEIDRIRREASTDPKHPYNDAKHAEHKAIHQRVSQLYAIANPGVEPQ